MSEQIPISRLEPHPLALRCASFCAGAERATAEAALAESVRECGVKVPLAVAPKVVRAGGDAPAPRDQGFWVLDGCARLEAARAAGLESVPCVGVEFADENAMGEEIFRLNTVRKPFTSSQRVMLWVDIHLGAVLESYSGKAGRPKKNASREAIFTAEDTAARLGVSRDDVAAAANLARCVNGGLVPCTVKGERSVRDATDEERARLEAVMASVREGRTPLRRWFAAFEGMASEEGGKDGDGRPKVNWPTFTRRTAVSLRTIFTGWRTMPPKLREPALADILAAVRYAPDEVADALSAALADRRGGAE